MAATFNREFLSQHSAEDVWRAVNTPLTGRVAMAVHPWFEVDYVFVGEDLQIEAGTRIAYRPSAALVDKVPAMFRGMLPEDITFRVEEHDPDARTRVDILESSKAEGEVRQSVREEDGVGLLVVGGSFSIEGIGSVAEGPAVTHAIFDPAERLLEHLPEVLRSDA